MHTLKPQKLARAVQRQRGWNLIELMVVVSIITILLAILINTAVEGSGPKEQTKVTLRGAMAAATEYEVTTTQKINHFSLPGTAANATSIYRFCYALWQLDRTRNALRTLGKDAVPATTNAIPPTLIYDGWGRALRYYSGEGNDLHKEDGVAASIISSGMPPRKEPYLGSAGPDGKWGTFTTQGAPDNDAKDNLYSFNLD